MAEERKERNTWSDKPGSHVNLNVIVVGAGADVTAKIGSSRILEEQVT